MSSKKNTTKTPNESSVFTRKIVGQSDLNPNGTLFGGIMMAWMDEIAFMSARRHAETQKVVTVNIDNIAFLKPIHLGETVVLTAQVNYVGHSSMEIGVKVEKENPFTMERVHTHSAYLTFVALDKRGKPLRVASLVTTTDDEKRRQEEALIRLKVRNRMKAAFKRKLEKQNKQTATTVLSDKTKSTKVEVVWGLVNKKIATNVLDKGRSILRRRLHSLTKLMQNG